MKMLLTLGALLLAVQTQAATNELTVYSVYDGNRLAPIFQPFTDRTGINVKVEYMASSAELTQRLKQEGASSPADVYLDKDIVFLAEAQRQDVFQSFNSATIAQNVPAQFISPGNQWFLIFYRARTIMYNQNKVSPSELSTYAALGDAKWKGRLCVRTSGSNYNQALAGSFLIHDGIEQATNILSSWVNNFSMDPIKGDTDLLKAIAEGKCDVGIANTYYLAPLIKADPNFPVRPFFANQNTTGTHLNGVGVALTKHTKNIPEATLLLEYLTSKEVQAPVAAGFYQYPVNQQAELVKELVDFGPFHRDLTNVGVVGAKAAETKAIFEKAGYK
ncbi:extracellular solute-binding protein [Bdellovibrio sp. HCB209]|uniref:extracellular solute-binding protein n=1 Tax=Bdellovibrio sp. HCB209 TaxID=3394354 RepID=UPI0039B3F4D1